MKKTLIHRINVIIAFSCIVMISLVSCKKPIPPIANKKADNQDASLLNETMMAENRYNPYSIDIIREVKDILSEVDNDEARMAGEALLQTDKLQLFYVIRPNGNTTRLKQIEEWLDSDESHLLYPFPFDSACLYPQIFTPEKIAEYQDNPEVYYTVTPISSPLPDSLNGTLLDTFYVPGSTETLLDFSTHLLTANLGSGYLEHVEQVDSTAYATIQEIFNQDLVLRPDGGLSPNSNANTVNLIPAGGMQSLHQFLKLLFELKKAPIWIHHPPSPADGRITFTENSRNTEEGVRGLKVRFIHFTFLGVFNSGVLTTDVNGHYDLGFHPPYCPGIMTATFKNSKIKIKNFNNAPPAVTNVIASVLSAPFAATYVRTYSHNTNPATMNTNFGHNTKEAFWSIIMNGIQEANEETVNLGMRSSVAASPYLCVLAYYTSTNPAPGGTPMLGHQIDGLDWMFQDLGINNGPSATSIIDLPDMYFSQRQNAPYDCNELRQTIYHEYGHTLHYFKVNPQYWGMNINMSLPSGYGSDINSTRGKFFALTEGWADYIGDLYAAHKYGTNFQCNEYDYVTHTWENDNYSGHLENIPTFFNDFIPRGLFYDLTDADNSQTESWDLIHGFSTNDIYQELNANVQSIQDFRDKWENDHPNSNNAALFNQYGIQ